MTEGNFTLVSDKGKKMSNYNNSNVVAMDMSQPDHMVSFGKKSGCYISRGTAWFLALLFISGMVATGLLVYYYAPRFDSPQEAQEPNARLETMKPKMGVDHKDHKEHQDHKDHKDHEGHKDMHMPKIEATSTTTTTEAPSSPPAPSMPDTTEDSPKMEEKLDVRLPRSLKPLNYVVKLQPLVNGNFSILGYVEIEMEVLESTSNITLHIYDIITDNDTVKLRPSGDMEGPALGIKMHEYDHEREFYIAHLEEPLEEGMTYTLSMHFTGYLNDKLKGFYRSSYKDEEGNDRWLAATQFQPTHARKAFPCFDEPGLKATFEVYLARQENMTSISNMPLADTMPLPDQEGWVWDHFNTTVPMSTYLVAFVVSDFAHLNTTSDNGTLFRVWAKESAIEQAEYSLEIGPVILTYFEEYFQVPYPLPKQDMIALPDFSAGAMENWGLITYRETAMLYDPIMTPANNKRWVAFVVSHELAHQWFGNIVTPEWWDDLWLNEGFATFLQYVGIDYVEPSWKVMEQFVVDKLQSVFAVDSLESSHRISIPVGHPDEISQIFDGISYSKGASIIRMMSHFLTEPSLRKGLSNYLEAFQYENAVQDDLWNYLTMAAHEDGTLPEDLTVKTIMDTWTLQMGYPVIKVTRSPDGTSAVVTQERFVLNAKNSSDDHHYSWWVPLNYASQESSNFTETSAMVWMKDSESEITISSLPSSENWVIFNIQETGYYRVNYDENNWNLLIQQLQADHEVIHTTNRAQIIDDAMDFARAGQLTYETALGVYSYLGNETDYVPWRSAVNNLDYLLDMFRRTSGYGALKNYIKDMIIPLYDSVGFQDDPSDPLLEQFKRRTALAWACRLGHEDCLTNATALFREWMQDPMNTSILSPNIKHTVYCRAIEAGGEEEWDFTWNMYLESNVASEKNLFLAALGCTDKIWLLSRYLEMAFTENSGIRRQDSDTVFAAVASNEIGRPLAWTYLRDNWDLIHKYHGKASKKVISSVTGNFNTRQLLREVEMFQKEHEDDLGAASRTVENLLENIGNNIAWMDSNYKVIVDWLEEKGYSSAMSMA